MSAATAPEQPDLVRRRLDLVNRHVQVENAKDVEALIATFAHPRYEFIGGGEGLVADGAEAVRQFWKDQYIAFPDFRAEVLSIRHADDAVILEVEVSGTHQGEFMGIPATGRQVRLRGAAFFLFEGDGLVSERIYQDSLAVFRQLGEMPRLG
jgi:steroid delta-isomerase-like uncharacterized protein